MIRFRLPCRNHRQRMPLTLISHPTPIYKWLRIVKLQRFLCRYFRAPLRPFNFTALEGDAAPIPWIFTLDRKSYLINSGAAKKVIEDGKLCANPFFSTRLGNAGDVFMGKEYYDRRLLNTLR